MTWGICTITDTKFRMNLRPHPFSKLTWHGLEHMMLWGGPLKRRLLFFNAPIIRHEARATGAASHDSTILEAACSAGNLM